jgi:hypothetical protein
VEHIQCNKKCKKDAKKLRKTGKKLRKRMGRKNRAKAGGHQMRLEYQYYQLSQ